MTSEKIGTGSHDLNLWLEGGYEKGIITLFYGPPASGKTNFVILATCHQAKQGKKILFIDTEEGFSIGRIEQITVGIPEMVLKNVILFKPSDFSEQDKLISRIYKEYKSKNLSMIVIDSITMHYRLELARARMKGISEVQKINLQLANEMKSLHEIARKKQIPVLITTQVYTQFLTEEEWLAGKEPSVGVVGGDILKYWSKCIIELQLNKGKRKAILKKHRILPQKEINFEIINEGIKKRGWF